MSSSVHFVRTHTRKGKAEEKMTQPARSRSYGMQFDAGKFLVEHIQWSHLEGHLKDRPSQMWTPPSTQEIHGRSSFICASSEVF